MIRFLVGSGDEACYCDGMTTEGHGEGVGVGGVCGAVAAAEKGATPVFQNSGLLSDGAHFGREGFGTDSAGVRCEIALDDQGGFGFVQVFGDTGGTPCVAAVGCPLFPSDVVGATFKAIVCLRGDGGVVAFLKVRSAGGAEDYLSGGFPQLGPWIGAAPAAGGLLWVVKADRLAILCG